LLDASEYHAVPHDGVPEARYDGTADWYDSHTEEVAESHAAELARLLGPGTGRCLDPGCGTGHHFGVIRATGRAVVEPRKEPLPYALALRAYRPGA
jgi:hypothetical protein